MKKRNIKYRKGLQIYTSQSVWGVGLCYILNNAGFKDSYSARKEDCPEFGLFNPNVDKNGFENIYIPTYETEIRQIILEFCIAMTEK